MREWKSMLEEEGRVGCDKAIQTLKARQQLESIESVATKSVVKYTEKLKVLAKLKPGV